jgi:hypothetical protein
MDPKPQPKQPQQPQGNFVAYPNAMRARRMQAGDAKAAKLPMFDGGKISVPGTDQEFDVALWGGKDGTGRIMFTGFTKNGADNRPLNDQMSAMFGEATPNSSANEIVEANMTFRPGQIAIFTNRNAEEAYAKLKESGADIVAAIREQNLPPQFYGRWHPGVQKDGRNATALVSISVWPGATKDNRFLLTGRTQYPLPGKNGAKAAPAMDADIPFDLDDDKDPKKAVDKDADVAR